MVCRYTLGCFGGILIGSCLLLGLSPIYASEKGSIALLPEQHIHALMRRNWKQGRFPEWLESLIQEPNYAQAFTPASLLGWGEKRTDEEETCLINHLSKLLNSYTCPRLKYRLFQLMVVPQNESEKMDVFRICMGAYHAKEARKCLERVASISWPLSSFTSPAWQKQCIAYLREVSDKKQYELVPLQMVKLLSQLYYLYQWHPHQAFYSFIPIHIAMSSLHALHKHRAYALKAGIKCFLRTVVDALTLSSLLLTPEGELDHHKLMGALVLLAPDPFMYPVQKRLVSGLKKGNWMERLQEARKHPFYKEISDKEWHRFEELPEETFLYPKHNLKPIWPSDRLTEPSTSSYKETVFLDLEEQIPFWLAERGNEVTLEKLHLAAQMSPVYLTMDSLYQKDVSTLPLPLLLNLIRILGVTSYPTTLGEVILEYLEKDKRQAHFLEDLLLLHTKHPLTMVERTDLLYTLFHCLERWSEMLHLSLWKKEGVFSFDKAEQLRRFIASNEELFHLAKEQLLKSLAQWPQLPLKGLPQKKWIRTLFQSHDKQRKQAWAILQNHLSAWDKGLEDPAFLFFSPEGTWENVFLYGYLAPCYASYPILAERIGKTLSRVRGKELQYNIVHELMEKSVFLPLLACMAQETDWEEAFHLYTLLLDDHQGKETSYWLLAQKLETIQNIPQKPPYLALQYKIWKAWQDCCRVRVLDSSSTDLSDEEEQVREQKKHKIKVEVDKISLSSKLLPKGPLPQGVHLLDRDARLLLGLLGVPEARKDLIHRLNEGNTFLKKLVKKSGRSLLASQKDQRFGFTLEEAEKIHDPSLRSLLLGSTIEKKGHLDTNDKKNKATFWMKYGKRILLFLLGWVLLSCVFFVPKRSA